MARSMNASCLGLVCLLAAVGCCPGGRAIEVRSSPAQDGLRVTGQGKATGEPDVARATLGVEVRAASAPEATNRASRSMRQVIDAVKAQGVAEKDLQTARVSVHFEHQRPPHPPPVPPPDPPREGAETPAQPAPAPPRGLYRASNSVRVTIRDLDKAADVLGAATAAGANVVHGLAFEIDDPTPLLEQAREEAVRDARRQAEQLASLAGVELGPVTALSAQPHFGVPRAAHEGMVMAQQAAGIPIERGELVVRQQVEILFSLEPAGD